MNDSIRPLSPRAFAAVFPPVLSLALPPALTVVLGCLAACGAVQMPEGQGPGLVSVDQQPPGGVVTYGRPTLREGTRFLFRKGGAVTLELRVQNAGDQGYELRELQSNVVTLLDRDLGERGQRTGDPAQALEIAPADPLFTWPLWVGKRWTAELLMKRPGAPPLPVQATYHCDAVETIEVPAGRFECLRIWKRLVPLGTGKYLSRASLAWYAPELGFYVLRLDGSGVLLELDKVVEPPPTGG